MRTSLNNIKAIDDYLLGHLPQGDAAVFEANMLLNDELAVEVEAQQNTYAIVKQYSRQQVKNEIVAVQQILATAPKHRGFMQRIANLFK